MKYIIIIIIITLGVSCNSKSGQLSRSMQYADYARSIHQQDSLRYVAMQDTAKYNAWLECSADQGDAGCDSCWIAIFGYSLEFK